MICGKHIFRSRDEAAAAMVGVNRDKRPGRSQNRLTTTYFCKDCEGWHIASRNNKHIPKHKSKELHTDPVREHSKKMRCERGVLIIRNYSSKPI